MANEKRPELETLNVPDQDGRDRNLRKDRRPMAGAGDEPRGVARGIADADKKARTGSADETVRDTPPFGDYDDDMRRKDEPRDRKGH